MKFSVSSVMSCLVEWIIFLLSGTLYSLNPYPIRSDGNSLVSFFPVQRIT
jgi:hypothetical protein